MSVAPMTYIPGSFCWTELNVLDPEAAKAFYTQLFGWAATEHPTPDGRTLIMLRQDGRKAASIMRLHPGAEAAGATPHWLSYVTVEDVDATAQRAAALGGKVLFAPFDVGEAGRMADLVDPTGGVFAVWKGQAHQGSEIPSKEPGGLSWHDYYTNDDAKAGAFYTSLFGYTAETHDAGPMLMTIFSIEEETEAGMFNMGPETEPAWRPFFTVADVEATVKRAEELGATIECPPIDMGERVFAHILGPEGVGFGIFQFR